MEWNEDAHSTCAPGGSCAACEACFTTVNQNYPAYAAFGGMGWEGTCGCFETARGGPPCSGAYAACPPCGESCTHCVTPLDGALPPAEQVCGEARARSHCRFALSLIHFIPDFLTYSVPLFLKRQRDRTLGEPPPCADNDALVAATAGMGCADLVPLVTQPMSQSCPCCIDIS